MAENKEKTEAELLEEAMQNLGLEEVVEEKKKEEPLVEGANKLTDEDIESLINDDKPQEEEVLEVKSVEESKDKKDVSDDISAVDDINLNNTASKEPIEEASDLELDDDEHSVQKKQSKVVRLLIIIVSMLLTLVSICVVLYFVGFFDPEPVKEVKKEEIKEIPKDEYKFNPTDIDANRLNKKLNLLTKYEIVENSDIEEQKAKEKENLYLEAKKQLEMERQAEIERIKDAERKRMQEQLPPIQKEDISENIDKEIEKVIEKEEPRTVEPTVVTEKEVMKEETPVKTEEVANQEQQPTAIEEKKVEETQTSEVTPIVETTTVKEEPKVIEEKPKVSQFVKVIKISTKSQDVYKSFLDKIYSVSDNITLCRDYNNNVEIFVGPFDDDLSRDNIAQEYLNKYNISVEIYDYTTEEYDKRCNY
jgi:hypothetical protein